MDPDMINCVILRIHVEKNMIIPSHAIEWQTGVSARNGSKKQMFCVVEIINKRL